jgi:hypothetical protein
MTEAGWPVDAGLLQRFQRAGQGIQWRATVATPRARSKAPAKSTRPSRTAHLHDENARVEVSEGGDRAEVTVESGPLGALVLLLEIDRRGVPTTLTQHPAHELPGFSQGAIRARWLPTGIRDHAVRLSDLVALARYALA